MSVPQALGPSPPDFPCCIIRELHRKESSQHLDMASGVAGSSSNSCIIVLAPSINISKDSSQKPPVPILVCLRVLVEENKNDLSCSIILMLQIFHWGPLTTKESDKLNTVLINLNTVWKTQQLVPITIPSILLNALLLMSAYKNVASNHWS